LFTVYNWLTGSIHLYFDTACMLITLVLLGKVLEQQAKGRVRRDLDSFFALQPAKVRLITEAVPKGRYVAIGNWRRETGLPWRRTRSCRRTVAWNPAAPHWTNPP
jgi:cation transport ATPase